MTNKNLCNVVFGDPVRKPAHVNDEPSGRRSAHSTAGSESIVTGADIVPVKSVVSTAAET